MKKRGKPSKWQWVYALGFIIAGLLPLLLPFFPERFGDRLISLALPAGTAMLLCTALDWKKFENLPWEAQARLDREDQDERNLMLRDRAAWLCWRGEEVLFAAGLGIAYCMDLLVPQILYPIFLLVLLRLTVYRLVRWWLNRKF